MPRKQPRQYRKQRRNPYPTMRPMTNMVYGAAGLMLGVGVLGAIANTSMNMWNK